MVERSVTGAVIVSEDRLLLLRRVAEEGDLR
ncbi:hypothetical protein SAZ_31575 [Streptomyces noursei ZPM]|nr:hypothetical protein SAZ_31575 [Streptomyces noursei ZPM]EPY92047.1 hypothetical protein K530_55400 [Streptomyces noursei CCRC 11814]